MLSIPGASSLVVVDKNKCYVHKNIFLPPTTKSITRGSSLFRKYYLRLIWLIVDAKLLAIWGPLCIGDSVVESQDHNPQVGSNAQLQQTQFVTWAQNFESVSSHSNFWLVKSKLACYTAILSKTFI